MIQEMLILHVDKVLPNMRAFSINFSIYNEFLLSK